MNYCVLTALKRRKSLSDNMLSRLCKNLNGYVVGNHIVFNKCAEEGIFCIGCRRESNLDFFKTNLYEKLEKFELFFKAHRDNKRLVAVTKVNRAPYRRFVYIIFLCPFHTSCGCRKKLSGILTCVHIYILSLLSLKQKSLHPRKQRRKQASAVPLRLNSVPLFMYNSYTLSVTGDPVIPTCRLSVRSSGESYKFRLSLSYTNRQISMHKQEFFCPVKAF